MTDELSEIIDPYFVQVTKKQAALILGRTPSSFDKLRKEDSRCPRGFKQGTSQRAAVMFRLSEMYEYSELLMQESLRTKRAKQLKENKIKAKIETLK